MYFVFVLVLFQTTFQNVQAALFHTLKVDCLSKTEKSTIKIVGLYIPELKVGTKWKLTLFPKCIFMILLRTIHPFMCSAFQLFKQWHYPHQVHGFECMN